MQFYTALTFALVALMAIEVAESRTSSRTRHRTRQDRDSGGGGGNHGSRRWDSGSDSDLSRPTGGQKRPFGNDDDVGGTGFNQNRPGSGSDFGIGDGNRPFNQGNNFGGGNVHRPQTRPLSEDEFGANPFNQNRPSNINSNRDTDSLGYPSSGPAPQLNGPNRRKPATTTAPRTTTACNCIASPEYNPVCGSNNQTYNNPKALECARTCNRAPGVQIAYRAACVDRPRI